jgi:serine/threonine protein kinase
VTISTTDSIFGRQSLEGVLVGGRFKVLELLGKGAAGEVYLAEHADLGRRYAIKVLKETVEADQNTVARFRREARAAGRLDHPNIVYIADFGRMEDGQLYLVMEYVPGVTLQEAIKAAPDGKLPRSRALEILRQVADALGAAHEAGVVHRDIKPGNILLSSAPGGGDRAKILDFGLAKIMIESELTALTARGEMFGTPAYMSPEQARGDPIDTTTDLYALGILGFELLTGRLPFISKSIPHMMLAHQIEPVPDPQSLLGPNEPPLPGPIIAVVLQCLAKDAGDRPASAAALVMAIEGVDAAVHASTVTLPVVQDPSLYGHDPASPRVVASPPMASPPTAQRPERPGGLAASSAEAVRTVLEQHADGTTRRVWALEQAGKVGHSIATQMVSFGLGGATLQSALAELAQQEQQQIGLETEVAVVRSRLEDLEVRFRERISSLRYAVADLSLERGRAVDSEGNQAATVLDIDYQIRELEKRLGEVSREEEGGQARVVAQLRERQTRLDLHRQGQSNADRKLISQVFQARPDPCPPQFQREYDALDLLMKAAFGA